MSAAFQVGVGMMECETRELSRSTSRGVSDESNHWQRGRAHPP
jgi:hypothetical protein